jgi:hypothetical protein
MARGKRLGNEVQLGFKQVRWLAGIDFTDVGDVDGGCNPATSSSAAGSPVSRGQPRRQEAQATSVACACDGALCG